MFDPANLQKFLSESSPSIFYLSDLSTGKFHFINENVSQLIPGFSYQFYQNGYEYFYSLIHENDYPVIIRNHREVKMIAADLNDGGNKVFVFDNNLRLKDKNSKWKNIRNIEMINVYKEEQIKIKVTGVFKEAIPYNSISSNKNSSILSNLLFSNKFPIGLAKMTAFTEIQDNFNSGGQVKLLELISDPESKVKISKREKEVLSAIASGLSTKEIAKQFFISESTVVTHRKHLLEKFDSKNTAELIKKASKVFWFE